MTSKEALITVKHSDSGLPEELVRKAIQIIEKDLEVLEILKKHIELTPYRTISGFRDAGLNDNEYNKVKEWLENGR